MVNARTARKPKVKPDRRKVTNKSVESSTPTRIEAWVQQLKQELHATDFEEQDR